MTGNTNKWRAPLAGLASLAMVATMGVVASTANAVTVNAPADSQVKDVSSPYSSGTVATGETYADILAKYRTGSLNANLLDGNSTTGAFGGFKVNDKFTALTGQAKDGDKITFANYDRTNGVRLHFVSAGDASLDLGYVWVPVSYNTKTSTVTVNPGQTPYDVADGYKLDLSKATATDGSVSATADLTNGGSFTFSGVDLTGKDLKVTVGATTANLLTFHADAAAGSDATPDIVYPGAIADGGSTTDLNLVVEVTPSGKYDPAALLAGTNINFVSSAYGIEKFVNGDGSEFTKDTAVTYKNWETWPLVKYAYKVIFKVNGKTYGDPQTVVNGQKAVKPADPTATDGSKFQGWYQDADNDGKLDNGESLFNFDTPITSALTDASGELVLTAWWANGGSHTVTYKFADGKTADKTETYLASQKTARPENPTRDGWIFDGWYQDVDNDGVLNAAESKAKFAFGYTLDGNVTLVARWLQANKATLEAAFDYVDGGDVTFNESTYQSVFTDASFKEYVATYQGVQKKYADAKDAADAKNEEIPADTYNSLLKELVAGWQKLEFVHEGNQLSNTTVYRLYNAKAGDHFYTQSKSELDLLTNNVKYNFGYSNEGRLFQTAPKAEAGSNDDETYAKLQSFAGVANSNSDIERTLLSLTDPILTKVTRLYNRVNGDHVWSVSADEVAGLEANADWNNEGPAFYVPRYTGSQSVTRLYNAKLSRHVLSTSASEQASLARNGWTVEGIAFKAY